MYTHTCVYISLYIYITFYRLLLHYCSYCEFNLRDRPPETISSSITINLGISIIRSSSNISASTSINISSTTILLLLLLIIIIIGIIIVDRPPERLEAEMI